MKEYIVWNAVDIWGGGDYNFSKVYESINWFDYNEVSSTIKSVLSSPKRKIALVPWLYDAPSFSPNYYNLSWAELVICWSNEPLTVSYDHAMHVAKVTLNNSNIIFVVNGTLTSNLMHTSATVFTDTDFASYTVYANRNIPDYTKTSKPKMFDCLLGYCRPHRAFILDNLKKSKLLDAAIVSLRNPENILMYQSPDLDLYDLPDYRYIRENCKLSAHTTNHQYPGTNYNIPGCFIIPNRIYENSWYSIVAETMHENYSSVTEKTIKPLLAKRIFISFASAGHLAYLKKLGYRTFDSILDESYDNTDDYIARMVKAWDQVMYLSTLDPLVVYKQAQDVLEHNYWHAINRRTKFKEIKDFIQSHIDKL